MADAGDEASDLDIPGIVDHGAGATLSERKSPFALEKSPRPFAINFQLVALRRHGFQDFDAPVVSPLDLRDAHS